MTVTELRSVLEPLLSDVTDLVALYRFGSRAAGEAHPRSDLDLALLAAPLDPMERFELQERIARQLAIDVDLVDLRRASTVLLVQVIDRGEVLIDASPIEREHFEARALSDYARLQEERRGILDDIRDRGSVHG